MNESSPTCPAEDELREVLEAGYLFELTWVIDDVETTAIVIHKPIERPSAQPLDGPAVFRFSTLGSAGAGFRVPITSIESIHPVDIGMLPQAIIESAAESLVDVASTQPRRIPQDAVSSLASNVSTMVSVRHVLTIADAVLEACDEIDPMLIREVTGLFERGDLANRWDDPDIARPAARCLSWIAAEDPSAVFDVTPQIAIGAESEDLPTRRAAVYTLAQLTHDYPEEVLPAIDRLLDAISSGDANMQINALSGLGRIVQSYPDVAEPVADEVAILFDHEDPTVEANAVGVFGDLSVAHPDLVMEYGSELLARLEDEDKNIRRNASIALLRAGEADPSVFRAHPDILEEALRDDVTEVRRNVCSVIGNARVEVSPEELARLAEEDPDQIVRDRANWALERTK